MKRIELVIRLKRSLLVLLAATAFGCSRSPPQEPGRARSEAPEPIPAPAVVPAPATVPAPAKPESGWSYEEQRDEMRGTITRFARVESENYVQLESPYNSGPVTLVLRNRPSDGLKIFLIMNGQFVCYDFRDDKVAVKFDAAEIEQYSCFEPDGGTSGVLFIGQEDRFIRRLKSSARFIVEIPVYDGGRQQITFNVKGLKWE